MRDVVKILILFIGIVCFLSIGTQVKAFCVYNYTDQYVDFVEVYGGLMRETNFKKLWLQEIMPVVIGKIEGVIKQEKKDHISDLMHHIKITDGVEAKLYISVKNLL